MAQNIFNSMELDAIGEIMNISLGSSATLGECGRGGGLQHR